jgi:hypothetical protein
MNHPGIIIVGLGSPHGDDQAGWIAAQSAHSLLLQHPSTQSAAAVHCCTRPDELLQLAPHCSQLLICDSAKLNRPGANASPQNAFTRIAIPRPWTSSSLEGCLVWKQHSPSSHGIELPQILELIEIQNDYLGADAVIYAIHGYKYLPFTPPDQAVVAAAHAAAQHLFGGLQEHHDSVPWQR